MSVSQEPPEPVTSDYVEVASLIIMFIIGGPVNLAAYSLLGERPIATRMDLLKKHLNYSDLMVLFVYAPSRICWLLTYDWRGGQFMCKLIKFLHSLAFQISSNIVVTIALDRVFSVLWPLRNSPKKGIMRTKIMLGVAWILAAAASSPQYILYGTYAAYVNHPNWEQCVQVWQKKRWSILLGGKADNDTLNEIARLSSEESLYSASHLFVVFWLPCMVVTISYITVSCWLLKNSRFTRNTTTRCAAPTIVAEETKSLPKAKTASAINSKSDRLPSPALPDSLTPGSSTLRSNMSWKRHSCGSKDSDPNSETELDNFYHDKYGHRHVEVVQIQIPNVKRVKRNAIRVSCLLVSVYLICWAPYMSLSMLQVIYPETWFKITDEIYFLFGLIVFNSVINPFLYGMFGKMKRITRSG